MAIRVNDICENTGTRHFCFVLIPGFSLVAFSCAIDALRAANLVTQSPAYSWGAVSAEENETLSSSGFALSAASMNGSPEPDVITICGGDRSHEYSNPGLTRWLNLMAKQGKAIGSISDGAFVLARAGLFSNTPSTIHWKCFDAYRERFPELDIRPSIIELSDKRFSCAGGTASLDLMLHFIRADFGSAVAGRIADNYFHDTIREVSEIQHVTHAFRIASISTKLADAALVMEDNLEMPLSIPQISRSLGISRRQLDRLFNRHLGTSAQIHYRELRMARACGLLSQTGMKVGEIALGCGFHSASHLGKFFKPRFGVTPGQYRRSGTMR